MVGIMAAFAVGIAVEVAFKLARGVTPASEIMSVVVLVALCALAQRRIANAGVLLAALGVAVTRSPWPDIAVGGGIAALFAVSAVSVLRDVVRQPA